MLVKTSKTSGEINKRVTCENCQTRYPYQLSRSGRAVSFMPIVTIVGVILMLPLALVLLSPLAVLPLGGGGFYLILRFRRAGSVGPWGFIARATGEDGDEDCDISANKKLRNELLKGVEVVPCPDCGWYQRDMVSEFRSRQLSPLLWAAVIPILASQAIAFLLTRHGQARTIGMIEIGHDHKVATWVICVCAGVMGMLMMLAMRSLATLFYNPNKGFPSNRPPVPGTLPALRESDYNAYMKAATAKLTATRNKGRVEIRTLPPRALPPPS